MMTEYERNKELCLFFEERLGKELGCELLESAGILELDQREFTRFVEEFRDRGVRALLPYFENEEEKEIFKSTFSDFIFTDKPDEEE